MFGYVDVDKATTASLLERMKQREASDMIPRAYIKMVLKASNRAVQSGSSAAVRSCEEQILSEGIGVLIDGGTRVEGYESDVTLTSALGKPSAKLQDTFEIVRQSPQDVTLGARRSMLQFAVRWMTPPASDHQQEDSVSVAMLRASHGPRHRNGWTQMALSCAR